VAGCAATKTKPIPSVEIASSASALLAMTSARRGLVMGGPLCVLAGSSHAKRTQFGPGCWRVAEEIVQNEAKLGGTGVCG
jgi:hypothetical protein